MFSYPFLLGFFLYSFVSKLNFSVLKDKCSHCFHAVITVFKHWHLSKATSIKQWSTIGGRQVIKAIGIESPITRLYVVEIYFKLELVFSPVLKCHLHAWASKMFEEKFYYKPLPSGLEGAQWVKWKCWLHCHCCCVRCVLVLSKNQGRLKFIITANKPPQSQILCLRIVWFWWKSFLLWYWL